MAFTPDGRYMYVGNYADQDFSILKVDGTNVVEHRASVQGARPPGIDADGALIAQFPTDCTCEKSTDSAPSSSCMPVGLALHTGRRADHAGGSAVVVPSALAAATANL